MIPTIRARFTKSSYPVSTIFILFFLGRKHYLRSSSVTSDLNWDKLDIKTLHLRPPTRPFSRLNARKLDITFSICVIPVLSEEINGLLISWWKWFTIAYWNAVQLYLDYSVCSIGEDIPGYSEADESISNQFRGVRLWRFDWVSNSNCDAIGQPLSN